MRPIRTSKQLLRRWLTLLLEDRRRARAATHLVPTAPNAPANLIGTDLVTYIQLDWQDMSGDELAFRVYRKADAGAYGLYIALGANVVTYQDHSVIISHVYRYYVTAFNAIGESAPSNEVVVVCGSS